MKISALIFHLENMKRYFGDTEIHVKVKDSQFAEGRVFELGRPIRPVDEQPAAIVLSSKEL